MNPEIKADWLTALRSGEYPQTSGALHSAEGYCCLGVLSDLAAKAGIVTEKPPSPENRWGTFNGCSSYLPGEVVKWAGLYDEQGNASGESEGYIGLPNLNDGGSSFAEIADIIEKRL